LVVCPTTLMRNWRKEIRQWWEGSVNVAIWYPEPLGAVQTWNITNYETFSRKIVGHKSLSQVVDLVILDESVLVKNRKAQRTKAAQTFCKPIKYVWELTGAPTTRLLDDLWAQFNILDAKRFSSYWKFAQRYCFVTQDQWGWHIVANKPDAIRQIQEDYADIYFSHTQDEVLDLPPFIFDDIEVELDPQQASYYKQMEVEFISELPEGTVTSPNVLSQITRLVQLASNPEIIPGDFIQEYSDAVFGKAAKWKAAVELLEYEQLPAIIWTSFIATADRLADRLEIKGFRTAKLTGKTPEKERQNIVDNFQAGLLDVIIAHPGVGKYGLTLTAARTAIYLERNYNGDDYFQSLHRVRRIGTKQSPHIIHLLATVDNGEPTIDHVIAASLNSKKQTVNDLTASLILEVLNGE